MKDFYNELIASFDLKFPDSLKEIDNLNSIIISTGKSALFMYRKLLEQFPHLSETPAIIVIPEGIDDRSDIPSSAEIVTSSHPHITTSSFEAGRRVIDFVSSKKDVHQVIYLLSGGSSALVEFGSDPEKIIERNRELLYSGLSIDAINRERIKISGIKGGKLTRFAPAAEWINLVMSDIPFPDAAFLTGSTPGYDPENENCSITTLADSSTFHTLFRRKLEEQGYKMKNEQLYFNGSVDELRILLVDLKKNLDPGEFILISGEPTLKVDAENPGLGGRMSHLALSILPFLEKDETLMAFSSDGIDGSSPYAGAVIPSDFVRLFKSGKVPSIENYLNNFDSYTFLEKFDLAVTSGYTGINLNDCVTLIRSV